VKLAAQMAAHPDGSTPDQTENWGDCKGAYRLFHRPEATFTALAEPHWRHTRDRDQGTWLLLGDTLLLQTGRHFTRAHRNNPDFYLVSEVEGWTAQRSDRAWLAIGLFAALIALMTTGVVRIEIAAVLTAGMMVFLGCISSGDARRSIEWQVLITIAAAFGVGLALQNSGAAEVIADALVEATRDAGPYVALACIYLLGSVMTALITNNAAAVLLFPFCVETARQLGTSPRPFLMALVLAASASFVTPIGYQTNMMVYGPGGYRFTDFVRIGLPLNLLLWAVAVVLVPWFWPFYP
jgi:di/tricarboxylate transporter